MGQRLCHRSSGAGWTAGLRSKKTSLRNSTDRQRAPRSRDHDPFKHRPVPAARLGPSVPERIGYILQVCCAPLIWGHNPRCSVSPDSHDVPSQDRTLRKAGQRVAPSCPRAAPQPGRLGSKRLRGAALLTKLGGCPSGGRGRRGPWSLGGPSHMRRPESILEARTDEESAPTPVPDACLQADEHTAPPAPPCPRAQNSLAAARCSPCPKWGARELLRGEPGAPTEPGSIRPSLRDSLGGELG